MKCISLWQPWATLIAIGAKRIETRSWATDYRGPLAIHAARRWTPAQRQFSSSQPCRNLLLAAGFPWWRRGPGRFDWHGLPRGEIVAVCRLVTCVPACSALTASPENDQERAFGDYSGGRWAWILADVAALKRPVSCRGQRGLFDVDENLVTGGMTQ